jgi:hypothetical protein
MADATLEESEKWQPEEGDSLLGDLEELKFVNSKFGEGLLITIKDKAGKLWSFFPSTDARRQILERYEAAVIDIGRPVGIKFVKWVETKNGSMKKFLVFPAMPKEERRKQAQAAVDAFKKQHSPSLSLEDEKEAERKADEARHGEEFE